MWEKLNVEVAASRNRRCNAFGDAWLALELLGCVDRGLIAYRDIPRIRICVDAGMVLYISPERGHVLSVGFHEWSCSYFTDAKVVSLFDIDTDSLEKIVELSAQ